AVVILDVKNDSLRLRRPQLALDQRVDEARLAVRQRLLVLELEDGGDVPDVRFVLELEAEARLPDRDDVVLVQPRFYDPLVVDERPVGAVHVEDVVEAADVLDLAVRRRHLVIVDDDVAFFAPENGSVATELDRVAAVLDGIQHAALLAATAVAFLL